MSSAQKRYAPRARGQSTTKTPKLTCNMSPGVIKDEAYTVDSEVVVVGAGPAGLMLAANLVRFGIKTTILDDRPDKTSTGRADGLQPKTIETLKQLRLAGPLVERGARIYDICFWSSSPDTPLRRTGREVHYPPVVDLLDPYIVLVHQGMVEEVFLDDLQARGVSVRRNAAFTSFTETPGHDHALEVVYRDQQTGADQTMQADFLIGCDGAHSQVRRNIPRASAEGASSEALWGVLDGELETDFPDLWSKAVIYSHTHGNILCIPRERNMTRFYIELKPENGAGIPKSQATQEYVMERARLILEPYQLSWKSVEWFGVYQIGQRVANRFTNEARNVFIAGDASHTHSPKAAQGMNTSMHDAFNLAWKLNLVIRGLAGPDLLSTYEHERRKIAQDLIDFDYEHANAFHDGDPEALAQNFLKNVRFISGVGVEYGENALNWPLPAETIVQPGCLLPPAKVTRYIDANPVDIQLDIPMLGQFRIYFFAPNLDKAGDFLQTTCAGITSALLTAVSDSAAHSYVKKPASTSAMEEYVRPDRYTPTSKLFTFALVTSSPKASFEIGQLPPVLAQSRWTIYLDDLAEKNSGGKPCVEKWIGPMAETDVAIVNVRPDGYVGSVRIFSASNDVSAIGAATWVRKYYSRFLEHIAVE